jgi:serine kinase of HPr protein (carbohydrate metabolism regulator)
MTTRWDLEEKRIIEVFGCSTGNKVIEAFPGQDRKVVKPAFYLDGRIEEAIIEAFGCISFEKVINLGANRELKKIQMPVTLDGPTELVVGLA